MARTQAKAGAGPGSDVCGQVLRSDAQRNRSAIVAAAHEVFAEQGLEAPMAEVARRAGVGIATLFIRFPARDDLITATFAATMSDYASAIDVAVADPDPWQGFCGYVQRACAMQARDRGFTDVLTRIFPDDRSLKADGDRAFRAFAGLTQRAKEAGRLRPDLVPEDLVMMLTANAGVIHATSSAAPQTSPRLVAYLLQAYAARGAQPLPPPPTQRRMVRALQRLHQRGERC
jgi:AcrR family transcriptional regulator